MARGRQRQRHRTPVVRGGRGSARLTMLEIKSDGTPTGTRVYVNGRQITDNVAKISWQHRGPDALPVAVVELICAQVSLATERVVYRDSQGRRIRRVEFED